MTIREKEKLRINKLKNPKAFIDYLQTIDPIDYNPKKKRKLFIVFDDVIADMEAIKTFYSHWIVFKWKKTQYLTCFYITILF